MFNALDLNPDVIVIGASIKSLTGCNTLSTKA
jgi:hypothetical protein